MKKKLGLYTLLTLALAGVGVSFVFKSPDIFRKAEAAKSYTFYLSVDSEAEGGNKDLENGTNADTWYVNWHDGSWHEDLIPDSVKVHYIRGRRVAQYDLTFNTSKNIQYVQWQANKGSGTYTHDEQNKFGEGSGQFNTFSIWDNSTWYVSGGYKYNGSYYNLRPIIKEDSSIDFETNLPTPQRIYIDCSKLGNNTTPSAIYFQGTDALNGTTNDLLASNYTDAINRTVSYDTYYDNSSTPTARSIGVCTVPWNASTLKVNTNNGNLSTAKAFDADKSKNLLVLYKSGNTVYGEWREPEIGIDDYMYLKLNDDTGGAATAFGLQHANSGTIKACYYNNYYNSTYRADPTTEIQLQRAGTVVQDGKTGDYYYKIEIPKWAVAVKLKDGGSGTGDPIQLIANKNVYYDVTGNSYTLAGHVVNNFDGSLAPSADNARVYIAPQLSGTWNIDSTSYKFGVQWWYGDTEPTDIFSYNVSLVTKLTDSLDGRSDIIYGYCDIPKTATKIRVILYLKSGNNYYPSYRSSTIVTVQNSTFSNFHVVTPATNSDYYCTTSLGNNADHHLGAPGPTILSNILEAYSTCDSSPYNGYGNGKELCENFYLDGASSATLNTLARCRGGFVDYTIGAHFATLYNKDTAHSSVEDVEETLAPYYAPNIEIQNSSNSTTLIVIICGVSAIALVSVTLLLAFSKKKK